MEPSREPQSAGNKCPKCGMAMVHFFNEYGSYSECTSCSHIHSMLRNYEQVEAASKERDDWHDYEDWLGDDDNVVEEGSYWSYLDRESPALAFRRETIVYIPRSWRKGDPLPYLAEDAIQSYAKHYLDICYSIHESRQMYRALMDLGQSRLLERYTRLSYSELVEQCNSRETWKHCKECGAPVTFHLDNEPKVILCQYCLDKEALKNPPLAILKTMPYVDYLMTNHWKNVRLAAIERAHGRCQLCNRGDKLHVHHRTYERRGEELPEDLTVLCAPCHEMFHKNGRVSS